MIANNLETDEKKITNDVLLVEDEALTQNVLKLRIEKLGYNCQIASSPEEAKALLDKSNFKLVITDIMMPMVNGGTINNEAGYNFGRELFIDKPQIKVICLTGRADKEIENKIRFDSKNNRFNLVEFFRKPFANQAFKTALRQAIG